MFKNKKALALVGFFGIILTFFLLIVPVFRSQAASLTSVYFYLSRMKAGIDGTGTNIVEYVIAFTPSQNIPAGGTVTLVTGDLGWCRTAGSDLTVAGVTSSPADATSTNWDIDSALPGTLTGSCTVGATNDTITVSGVTALTAGTTYGVKITNGTTAKIGTNATAGTHYVTVEVKSGITIDSSTIGIQLVADDQVVVTADVTASPSVTCTLGSNTVSLGSLYPGGSYATGTHTLSTTTSSTADGYYWAVYGLGSGTDAGLYKSTATTYLIPSTGSTTIDLRGIGTEGFGMTASDPDAADTATVATDFADTTAGVFGALDTGSAGAQLLLSQIGAQTSAESSTITYGARAGASAQTGSYQETVTFVCGGYY